MAKQKTNMSEAIRQVLKANPSMSAKEVIATLAKKGIEVKEGLVYFVKGQIQGRKGKTKKAKATTSEPAKAAVANGAINKSEEIRKVLKSKPGISTKDVVSTLAAQGIEVSKNLVHLVKGKKKGRQHRKEKVQKTIAKVAETTGSADALSTILKVKGLANDVGGMVKLQALVEALS